MAVGVAFLATSALTMVACAPRPVPRPPLREVCAPVPGCPSWLDVLRSEQTTLHVHLFDRASSSGCAAGTKLSATVSFDGQEIAVVGIVCGETAPALRIDGPWVSLGLHELTVHAHLPGGDVEASSVVSLPAIDVAGDGKTATLGAELLVELGIDEVVIGPPQVYPPH